ncbi:hypothetical protein [Rosenbergiella epipactidis]
MVQNRQDGKSKNDIARLAGSCRMTVRGIKKSIL